MGELKDEVTQSVSKVVETSEENSNENKKMTEDEKAEFIQERAVQFLKYVQDENYEEAYKMTIGARLYPYWFKVADFEAGIKQSKLQDFVGSKEPFEITHYNGGSEVTVRMNDNLYMVFVSPIEPDNEFATEKQRETLGDILLEGSNIVGSDTIFYTAEGAKLTIDDVEVEPDGVIEGETMYSVGPFGFGPHTFKVEIDDGRYNEYEGTLEELANDENDGVYIYEPYNYEDGFKFVVIPTEEEEEEISNGIMEMLNTMYVDYANNPNEETLKKYFIASEENNMDKLKSVLDKNIKNYNMSENNYPKISSLSKRTRETGGVPTYRYFANGDIKCFFQATTSYHTYLNQDKVLNKFGCLDIRKSGDGTYKIVKVPEKFSTDIYSMYEFANSDWE